MKVKNKYKNLIPLALVVFMAAAWYQLINSAVEATREYNQYVEAARRYAEDGVLVDSVENYNSAIQMKDSVELRTELADVYRSNEMYDEAVDAAEAMISAFPQNALSYEYLIELYISQELYADCFGIYDRANKIGAVSDRMREIISDIKYKYDVLISGIEDVSVYSNGICAIKTGDYWGFVSEDGQSIIGAKYKQVGDFTGDKVFAETVEGEKYFMDSEENKRGVLPEGVTPGAVGNEGSGLYPIEESGVYNYYSSDKAKVFGGYAGATTFADGYAAVLTESGYGLIDTRGTPVGAAVYADVALDERKVSTERGRAFFLKESAWIMVSMDGNPVGGDSYEDAKPFYPEGGYAAVKKDGAWGFVNEDGEMVVAPQFEDARSFCHGHAAVKKDGMWGFIDASGAMVIEPVFQEARDMNASGNIFVKENGGWELISLYQYNY